MQGPTHLATGILIQKMMKKVRSLRLRQFLVIFLSILSHGILDKLARFTYHPPTPLPGDWFWVSYHIIIAFIFLLIFIKYWGKFKLGLVFSVLPDFDWVMLQFTNFFSVKTIFWNEAILHKVLLGFLNLLPPFSFINSLPNWNLERKAVIIEFATLAILTTFIYTIGKEKSEKSDLVLQERSYAESKQEILTSKWIDKVPIFQTGMDHEQTIRTSYQSLLTTLEVVILGLFFTLYQLNLTNYIWLLPVSGILLCIIFGIPCEYRAKNVDYWRIEIVRRVSVTDLEDAFKGGKYRWIPFGKLGTWGEDLFGHWFERLLISITLIIWQIPLWILPSPFILFNIFIDPLIIRSFCLIALCSWIVFVFGIFQPKGKIIVRV